MTTGHLDTDKYNNQVANASAKTVISSPTFKAFIADVKDKIDSNYDEAHALNDGHQGIYNNAIINGNMEISQRLGPLGSTTIVTGASVYTVDRMRSVNIGSGVNATVSHAAVADLDGASYGLQINHAALPTVQAKLMHVHTLEARTSYKLAGQSKSISIKVKGIAGMDRATLIARYRTTEGAISDTSTLIGSSAAIPINSSGWTEIVLTVTLPSRATLTTNGCIGYQVVFSKTTAEASGDGAIIAQWHDNKGGGVLPFQPNSFVEDLMLCQRYYEKNYGYTSPPGTVGVNGVVYYTTRQAVAASTVGSLVQTVSFKVTKRATPTVTLYSPLGTANAIRVGTSTNRTGATTANNADSGFSAVSLDNTSTTVIALDNLIEFYWAADAELS